MKTKTQFLVSSLTLVTGVLAMLVASTTTVTAQFFSNPGQGQQVQQQLPTYQGGGASYSSTTHTTVIRPRGGILAPVGWSTAHPGDAIRERSLTRSGNGEYFHQSVQRIENTQRVILQDQVTGRRQAVLVQTVTDTTSKSQFNTLPYYPTTVQVAYKSDAPKYTRVSGPNPGKRWSR
jgi:hypothetical protein